MSHTLSEFKMKERDRENIKIGEENIATLAKTLMADNRFEDLRRALRDKEYCNQLIDELGIEDKITE
jgi:hypothetical protein